MIKRFVFELCVGICVISFVLLFGKVGGASLALFALLPFFSKKRPDERERQLFYQMSTFSFAVLFALFVCLDQFGGQLIKNLFSDSMWVYYGSAAFFIIHGLSGLIIFKKN